MKLYALLTFLLALPLFVRLLPDASDDTASAATPGAAQVESPNQSATQSKAAQKPAPAAAEKQTATTTSENPAEPAH
jgi:hypothetical protein